ncbi:MAG: D-aminoacylase [Actinomycetia bacterium]|nr:D-aminoacylase [Actinomycetes bacterium]
MSDVSDIVFRNATVVDGTGSPPVAADVLVVQDRISAVGEHLDTTVGSVVIDATGLVLAPGFIDVHTHDDAAVLVDPDLGCKTLQGVTSVVVGNCGMSLFPEAGLIPGMPTFGRADDYLARLADQPSAVNVATLVGHGTVRTAVMGLQTNRQPDRAERTAMADLVSEALADGAIGMSSGLAYEPGRYAAPGELIELAKLLVDSGAIYTTHMRDEADGLLASVDESIMVAEEAGVPLQISHLKAAGRENWGTVNDALDRIDNARQRGIDVMADQYPYTRGSTLLEQVISAGAFVGPSPFGHLRPEDVLVAAAPVPDWSGKTIAAIAAEAGVSGQEMADRMVTEAGRDCFVVLDTMSEDDVQTVMAHPAVMTGSDGIPIGDKPHPRLHHTYPRLLGHYCRQLGVLDLSDAIHRMTAMPATRFGFKDRGVVTPGAFADLVLLNPQTITDTGTYADPTNVPTGIEGVWVNGVRVIEAGTPTGDHPGQPIRH